MEEQIYLRYSQLVSDTNDYIVCVCLDISKVKVQWTVPHTKHE